MLKYVLLLFAILPLYSLNPICAQQPVTTEEIKAYMCKYKWMLRRLEGEDQFYSVPEEMVGQRMVFKSNGYMYMYLPGQDEKKMQNLKWQLKGNRLTISNNYGSETYSFEFKNYIGYKIYTRLLDGEDNPTYVWEQSEKIELPETTTQSPVVNNNAINKPSNTTPNPSASGGAGKKYKYEEGYTVPANSSSGQWYMCFSKENQDTKQRVTHSAVFPRMTIQKKLEEEGMYVSNIVFGGKEKPWFVTYTPGTYTEQRCIVADSKTAMQDSISKLWNNNKFRITELTCINGKWVLLAVNTGKGNAEASYYTTVFSSSAIEEYWNKGFRISQMAYNKNEGWIFIFAKDPSITNQRWNRYEKWEHSKVFENRNEDYLLADVVKADNYWYAVYDERKDVEFADFAVSKSFETEYCSATLKKYLSKNFRFTRAVYIPGTED